MGHHKKQFRDMIALNKWFAACFLFAIDKRFQRWLNKGKWAQISRADVNDRIIDFSNIIELVLNRTIYHASSALFPRNWIQSWYQQMLWRWPSKGGQQKEAEVRQEREAREVSGSQEQTLAQVIQDKARWDMEEDFQVSIRW
jgi:hypothetical protein